MHEHLMSILCVHVHALVCMSHIATMHTRLICIKYKDTLDFLHS